MWCIYIIVLTQPLLGKNCFILSNRSDIHMTDSLSIPVHVLASCVLMSLSVSWRQHPTKQQLYSQWPTTSKTIQIRRTRYAGHCWRSKDELLSDVLLWTPSHGRARVGRPGRTYLQQFCTGCSMEDLPRTMDDRDEWQDRVREIRASGTPSWFCINQYIYIYIYLYFKKNQKTVTLGL